MTNAFRLYRTYILSENVPMNTNRKAFGVFCGVPARIRTGGVPLRRRTLYPAEVQRPIYNFIYIIACLFCKGKRLSTTLGGDRSIQLSYGNVCSNYSVLSLRRIRTNCRLGGDRSIRLSYGNTTLILYHGIMFCAIPLLLFYSVLCCKTAVSMSYRHGDSGFIGLKLSYCRAVQRSSLK